jgi:hypothetical protein
MEPVMAADGLKMDDQSAGIPVGQGHTYDWPEGSHAEAVVDESMSAEGGFRMRDEPAPGPSKQTSTVGTHKDSQSGEGFRMGDGMGGSC